MKQEEIEKSLRLIEGIYSIDEAASILRNELRVNVEPYTNNGFYGWTFYPENKVKFMRTLEGNSIKWIVISKPNR